MRFPYFVIIWVSYVVLAGISMFETDGSAGPLLILTIGAVIATGFVMDGFSSDKQSRTSDEAEVEKAKRSPDRSPDNSLNSSLLALLDDPDREVLRQQIMQRLMDNIDHSSDGELNTLEALLAEKDHRLRR